MPTWCSRRSPCPERRNGGTVPGSFGKAINPADAGQRPAFPFDGDDSDHASATGVHKVRPDDVCDALYDQDDVDEQQDPHDPSKDAEKGLVP